MQYDSFGWSYQWDAENGLRIDTTSAPARLPTEPDTGDAALDKALTILNNKYATGGKYRGMLEGGGKKTSFDATLDVTNRTDAIDVTLTAEPFPFFDGGVSYTGTLHDAVNGGLASDARCIQLQRHRRSPPAESRCLLPNRSTSASALSPASSPARAASASQTSSAPPLRAAWRPGR